jgi:hypothetical protein
MSACFTQGAKKIFLCIKFFMYQCPHVFQDDCCLFVVVGGGGGGGAGAAAAVFALVHVLFLPTHASSVKILVQREIQLD